MIIHDLIKELKAINHGAVGYEPRNEQVYFPVADCAGRLINALPIITAPPPHNDMQISRHYSKIFIFHIDISYFYVIDGLKKYLFVLSMLISNILFIIH